MPHETDQDETPASVFVDLSGCPHCSGLLISLDLTSATADDDWAMKCGNCDHRWTIPRDTPPL